MVALTCRLKIVCEVAVVLYARKPDVLMRSIVKSGTWTCVSYRDTSGYCRNGTRNPRDSLCTVREYIFAIRRRVDNIIKKREIMFAHKSPTRISWNVCLRRHYFYHARFNCSFFFFKSECKLMNQFYSLIEHLHFYTLTEYFWKCDAIIWVSFKIFEVTF